MKLVFVNIMQELQRFDSTAYITQPPVPLGLLAGLTPPGIETYLVDEQTESVAFHGDAFAFSVTTQNARAVYAHADALRAAGKIVILGGIHPTVLPDEAARHADAVVTGEAEGVWPGLCDDLRAGRLGERYAGAPTPAAAMRPVDYRFFGRRPYLTPASLFATRGCTERCEFCVSSSVMGPYRTKPLDVLEREIDQLATLRPEAFLQFTDDNLLAHRGYRRELLGLLQRKGRRFVTMITVEQLCDPALVEAMAAAGCLGVVVGVESLSDENCRAVGKYKNVAQPFADVVRRANALGVQTGALVMVGLPRDTPAGLDAMLGELSEIPCAAFDVRVMRAYPSAPLYDRMLAAGEVFPEWWLSPEDSGGFNALLPSCLGVYSSHPAFAPGELQRCALRLAAELNAMRPEPVARIVKVGLRARSPGFAATTLFVRRSLARQARILSRSLDDKGNDAVG
jgi:radical SAM superfamily enzyme YgiQ (UPF0313 family)